MEPQNLKVVHTSRGPVEYLDEGIGEAVLSLHGVLGGYDQAQVLVRTIGRSGYRYLSLSRPGYLGTPLAAGRTPEEQADRYAEFIQLLNIKQVIVIAISGGGSSAIHFARRHADKCKRLVLVSSPGGMMTGKIPLAFHAMCYMARLPILAAMMQKKAEKNLKASLRRAVSDPVIFERMVTDAEVMDLYRVIAVGCFHKMAQRIAGTRNDIKVSQTRTYPLQDISVPTLVIHGTEDPLLPFPAHGKKLASEIPGAQLLAVEGGGHGAIFTHRDEVRLKVASFLEDANLGFSSVHSTRA